MKIDHPTADISDETKELPEADLLTETESETETTSENGDPDESNDESPYTKTYVAIDGIDPEELTDAQIDRIERAVTDHMLLEEQEPITGVRVVTDKSVVEYDPDGDT